MSTASRINRNSIEYNNYVNLQKSGSDWSYGSRWGDQMEAAIIELFKDKIPLNKSIIDIGCGEGRGLSVLKNLGYDDILGVDISDDKINVGKYRQLDMIKLDFHHDLKLIPFYGYRRGKFDIAFCSHTLEHSYDIKHAISEILNFARQLYIIVPIGETEEQVKQYNPSHTSPIKDREHFHTYIMELGLQDVTSYIDLKRPSLGPELCVLINKE